MSELKEETEVIIPTIDGIEKINDAATRSMQATLDSLVSENLLSKEKADAFANTHVVALINDCDMWQRIRKLLRIEEKHVRFIVLRISG